MRVRACGSHAPRGAPTSRTAFLTDQLPLASCPYPVRRATKCGSWCAPRCLSRRAAHWGREALRGWTPVRPLRRAGVAFFRTRLARYIQLMILARCMILVAAPVAPHERVVAVLPVAGGALDAGAASALETEVRAAVVEVLGEDGVVSAAAQSELLAGSRPAPADAARKLSATHVLSATARRMEGALGVSFTLVSSEGKSLGTARLVGFTPAEVRAEARGK